MLPAEKKNMGHGVRMKGGSSNGEPHGKAGSKVTVDEGRLTSRLMTNGNRKRVLIISLIVGHLSTC